MQLTIPAPDGTQLQLLQDGSDPRNPHPRKAQTIATATAGRIEADLPLSLSADGKLRLQLVEP